MRYTLVGHGFWCSLLLDSRGSAGQGARTMDALPEREFENIADRTLNELIEALADAEEEGIDADLESGVLSIRFDDGTKYVVNSHRAARQIWMAAESTAWHFDWNGSQWLSTKTGEELWTMVREKTSKKLGKPLDLQPPR